MTEPVSAKTAFSRAAPAYEPEVWNDRNSKSDYQNFLDAHRDVIAAITKHEMYFASRDVIEGRMKSEPVQTVKNATRKFLKDVEQGLDDAAIAQKYKITPGQSAAFRAPAAHIYLKGGFEDFANCYSYAMNDPDRYNLQGADPGERLGNTPEGLALRAEGFEIERLEDYAAFRKHLLKSIETDGAILAGKDAQPMEGYYRVAVYSNYLPKEERKGSNTIFDMHFAREDNDGTWSHKFGRLPVTKLDSNGKPITNPATANLGGYEFLTYVYVPEGGLDVGRSYEPITKSGTPKKDYTADDRAAANNADYPFPERQLSIPPQVKP